MKIKFNKKNLNTKIFFKSIIDTMIPASVDKLMPKASDAINLNKFLEKILKDKSLIKKLNKIDFNKSKTKKIDFSKEGKIIAKCNIIEINLEKNLLEAYFSSKLVQKQLNKKTKRTKNKDKTSLLKLVKNSSLRYKHI